MTTDFQQKLTEYTTGGLVCLAISLGKKLGLLEALDAVSSPETPATPKQVADKANCNERYVKEWLSFLACADLFEVNEDEKFWIDAEKRNDLINAHFTVQMQMTPTFCKPIDKLIEAFRNDNPRNGIDYSEFTDFYDIMNAKPPATIAYMEKTMADQMLPDIDADLKNRLETENLKVLDVGCGTGFHANYFAKNFPKASVVGVDILASAIQTANENKMRDGLENLQFSECSATSIPLESNSIDFVMIFDACHDQQRPDLCMKEIHRLLKPDGVFAMVEMHGTGNVFKDKQLEGPCTTIVYGWSLFHCLPVGSNSPDALCLGAKWGIERGQKLLRDGGFSDVKVVEVPYFPISCMYVARK